MKYLNSLAAAAAMVAVAAGAQASPISFGTVDSGGIAIYYNAGGPEIPAEQAYFRAQLSQADTRGALFNFDPNLAGAPGYGPLHPFQVVPDQFGLDLILPLPTADGSVVAPTLTAYDNVDGTVGGRAAAGPVVWAINDYKPGGPLGAGSDVVNSVLRGSSVDITMNLLSVVGTVYTVEVAGKLISDGLIHWFNPLFGTTSLADFGLKKYFLFSATLSYDSAGDTGLDLIDFYAGTGELFAVPEPASLALFGLGLVGLGFMRRRRTA